MGPTEVLTAACAPRHCLLQGNSRESPDICKYINKMYQSLLQGTSREHPAVCKYTGNKYYSDDWKYGGGH